MVSISHDWSSDMISDIMFFVHQIFGSGEKTPWNLKSYTNFQHMWLLSEYTICNEILHTKLQTKILLDLFLKIDLS